MLKKESFLLTIILSIVICMTSVSCTKDCNCPTTSSTTTTTPIGTTVKYEVSTVSTFNIASIAYYDVQANSITKINVPSVWSYTFQTTKNNQTIILQSSAGSALSITGKVYIDGIQKREASGSAISITYP